MKPSVAVVRERDARPYSGPAEYPCVRRFRHRRLATFLFLDGFRDTFRALMHETDAFLCVGHLCQLVKYGLWEDAISYLSRFLLPTAHRQSDEAQVLHLFLRMHKNFANIAAGKKDNAVRYLSERYKHYANHDNTVCYGAIRIRSITLSILYSDQVRASLDWERVRFKAADIVDDLAYKIPELKDLVLMPGGPMRPQNVLPIGFGFRRRHHVKKPCRPRASALAKLYLEKRRRLPSSSHHQELHRGFSTKARNWLADVLDESLSAGTSPELQKGFLRQLIGKEGPPVLQAMSGALTNPTGNSGTSSVTNAGTAVFQTMFDTLTIPAKNSEIISVTNAGTNKYLTREGCYTESALQSFKPRKNPEPTIVEEYIDTKKQRTTGAFGEASTVSVIDLGAEGRSRTGGLDPLTDGLNETVHD